MVRQGTTAGGGNSAGQAALFLSERARWVSLVACCEDLGDDMSRYLVDRILNRANIEVNIQHEVKELLGDGALEAIRIANMHTGAERTLPIAALFVFIGADAIRLAASAVGEGSMAVRLCHMYLAETRHASAEILPSSG